MHWERLIEHWIARLEGPLHLRLVFQPTVAALLGVRDGVKDARCHAPAYFWAIFTKLMGSWQLLLGGIKSVLKVFVVAVVLDGIYQVIALRWFYPGAAILVALQLAFIPYLLIRGPVNRIATWWWLHRTPRRPARFGAFG